ncbi:hypothetical protein PHJA_002130100 [Phtheirospermum japonicum]|uniref:Uncharacterized protein n=1 Tax=Phtheirospermum japonicum TaxID=374723 RepID=A0A830CJA5_9LAMI|nr:hypothetical protein PHJA_002130100 [Phtheirospermum japonicum]
MWSPLVVMITVSMAVVFQCDVAVGINLKWPPPPRQPMTYKVGGASDDWGWRKNSNLSDWVKRKKVYVLDTFSEMIRYSFTREDGITLSAVLQGLVRME